MHNRSARYHCSRIPVGGRSSTARTGTVAPPGQGLAAPTTTAKTWSARGIYSDRSAARRNRRGKTFGRKAPVHRPAAVAETAAFEEYVTTGRKARLHRPAVVGVPVNEQYVTFGRKTQVKVHPSAAVVIEGRNGSNIGAPRFTFSCRHRTASGAVVKPPGSPESTRRSAATNLRGAATTE